MYVNVRSDEVQLAIPVPSPESVPTCRYKAAARAENPGRRSPPLLPQINTSMDASLLLFHTTSHNVAKMSNRRRASDQLAKDLIEPSDKRMKNPSNSQACLLGLPAELRNFIYKLVLGNKVVRIGMRHCVPLEKRASIFSPG